MRPFEIFDQMNVADEASKTELLAMSPYLVEAKTAKGGGHVTMGVPAEVITQLMTGDRKAILLVFDKKEYDRIEMQAVQPKTINSITDGVFINETLLLAAGFDRIERDGFECFIKDRIEVFDFNGECWIVDMLDQNNIEKQFKFMEELESFFQGCGLSIYNPKTNTNEQS